MKKLITSLLFLNLALSLSACVELRDPEKDPTATDSTPVQAVQQQQENLLVDRPLYLYQGHLISDEDLKEIRYFHPQSEDWAPKDAQLNFNRITFTKEGVIYVLGNKLKLQAQELISEGGRIETYPPDRRLAAPGQPGQDGGKIFIQIEEAKGDLQIRLVGQEGGGGASGRDFVLKNTSKADQPCYEGAGGAGANGFSGGASGFIQGSFSNADEFRLDVQVESAPGGQGGQGGIGYSHRFGYAQDRQFNCYGRVITAPDGANGARGPAGRKETSLVHMGKDLLSFPRAGE